MKKTILPEVYKLTSPNPRNNHKAEIHKDSGLFGIEFTVDKTIPDFNKGADKVELDYATAFVEFENVLEGAATKRLATANTNATSPSGRRRRSLLANHATFMAIRLGTPMRSAAIIQKKSQVERQQSRRQQQKAQSRHASPRRTLPQ